MREAHLRDAVALCDFFAFLEDTIGAGGTLTEVQVSHWEAAGKLMEGSPAMPSGLGSLSCRAASG